MRVIRNSRGQYASDNRPRTPPQGRTIKPLIADRNIRVIDTQGQLIRELVLGPARNYQPLNMSRDDLRFAEFWTYFGTRNARARRLRSMR